MGASTDSTSPATVTLDTSSDSCIVISSDNEGAAGDRSPVYDSEREMPSPRANDIVISLVSSDSDDDVKPSQKLTMDSNASGKTDPSAVHSETSSSSENSSESDSPDSDSSSSSESDDEAESPLTADKIFDNSTSSDEFSLFLEKHRPTSATKSPSKTTLDMGDFIVTDSEDDSSERSASESSKVSTRAGSSNSSDSESDFEVPKDYLRRESKEWPREGRHSRERQRERGSSQPRKSYTVSRILRLSTDRVRETDSYDTDSSDPSETRHRHFLDAISERSYTVRSISARQ